MSYSLEYLIELSKRTGDRLIVHDSVMGEAFVIMPLESYESFLNERRGFLDDDEFEPESDADVLNRINSEIDAWRERQNEEALAEWEDAEDEDSEDGGDREELDDEIDADEEPMYHEIIEEKPDQHHRGVVPILPSEEPKKEDIAEVFGAGLEGGNFGKPVDFSENPIAEEAPWEKFKKMGAPLDPEELLSIPETTDFSDMDFRGDLVDSDPLFLDEPMG
ncbi:MAG TPA: hypothetical protein PLV72_02945 [Candidatus Magasanikbacteria bacterium]|mgnify:CR=1 FL=1|nr:hypothetical protein [Candidatus Magasanikbacteria bacterium]